MAKRQNRGRPADAATRARKALLAEADARFRALHPEKARAERALRKALAEQRRDFGHHRHGTVETRAKAAAVRQGAIMRLFLSGAISIEQKGAADEIAAEAERIGAAVSVRGASLETRVDVSRVGEALHRESLMAVRRAVAYSRWRAALVGSAGAAPVLAMIIEDIGIAAAARRFRLHHRRARRLLIEALDLWPELLGRTIRDIDQHDLDRAEARVR